MSVFLRKPVRVQSNYLRMDQSTLRLKLARFSLTKTEAHVRRRDPGKILGLTPY